MNINLKKKSAIFIILVMLINLVFVACGKNDEETTTTKDNKKSEKKEQITNSRDAEIYKALFSLNTEVKIDIDIDEEELQKIQNDYDKYSSNGAKSPIYRKADMTITVNGTKYEYPEVGIRMKGNTSRKDFYNKEDGIYNIISFKISFDETFDDEKMYGDDVKVWNSDEERKERKNRTFATLKGLELKWNNENDSTYIRETYVLKMYRDFGLLAPNNTLGTLSLNDNNFGVYKIYEPVDKIFIQRNFDEEDWGGDLYKCSYGMYGPADYTTLGNKMGVDDGYTGKNHTYELKTNKDTSEHESMINFVSTIRYADYTREDIEKVVDIDNFVKFMAVSYFMGNPDDLRNNYNNHYIYFKKSTGQAVFIAYDNDIVMGDARWNPTGKYMTEANPYSEHAYGSGGDQNNKLFRYCLKRDGVLFEEYKSALESVANSKWMTFENFEEMYEKVAARYSDSVVPDIEFENSNEAQITMSIDDTYIENGSTKRNDNMPVENYMTAILNTYSNKK